MEDPNDTPPTGKGTFIPEDVLSQCLARLSVKSLIRFKAVCKSWKNLISSPVFAEIHFHHSKTNEQVLAVGLHPDRHYLEMTLLKLRGSRGGDGFCNLSLPFVAKPTNSVMIEGSCNGLLICRTKYIPGIVLCNPATRGFRPLSLPFVEDGFSNSISIGFCFISEMKDYKIIVIRNNINGERSSSGTEISHPGWVYSLNSDSWKKLDVSFPYIYNPEFGLRQKAIVCNECLHWIADEDEGRIATFDVKKEVLQCMSCPIPKHLIRRYWKLLTVIEGCLSMGFRLEDGGDFEVWKMSEYGVEASWIKLFRIDPFRISAEPMGSWKGRRIVFQYFAGKGNLLFSYNPCTRNIEPFRMPRLFDLQVINYVESLESVEGGMRRISQNRRAAKTTGPANSSKGIVISDGHNKTKEDDSEGPTSGKRKHDALESSNNFEGGSSRKGKGKLQ